MIPKKIVKHGPLIKKLKYILVKLGILETLDLTLMCACGRN